jgi:hypothetical protein
MKLHEEIKMLLENNLKLYITAYDNDGNTIKIRIADHRMNERNNDRFTLSFISNNTGKNDSTCYSNYEFVCDGEWANEYSTIEDILKEFEIVKYISNNQLINA